MKLFENTNIVIEQDKKLKCLIQNWKGFATSEKFREAIEKTIELFKSHEYNKILSNTHDFGLVRKEDTDWSNTYAMPLLLENGLQFVAFVQPRSAFSQISVENFSQGAQNKAEIRYFNEVQKAREWMAKKP